MINFQHLVDPKIEAIFASKLRATRHFWRPQKIAKFFAGSRAKNLGMIILIAGQKHLCPVGHGTGQKWGLEFQTGRGTFSKVISPKTQSPKFFLAKVSLLGRGFSLLTRRKWALLAKMVKSSEFLKKDAKKWSLEMLKNSEPLAFWKIVDFSARACRGAVSSRIG